jgi:hypothetical protein|eukprot:SAG31_NODE_355_length_17187_cov_15.601299_13_plen_98_part_00
MKKITTNQWLIGGGIVALLFILYKKQQNNKTTDVVGDTPVKDTPVKDTPVKDTPVKDNPTSGGSNKIDTSGIPKQCLNGFDLKGVRYSIKGDKFIKE